MTIHKSQAHKMDFRSLLRLLLFLPLIILFNTALGSEIKKYWIYFEDECRDNPIQLSRKANERRYHRGIGNQSLAIDCPPAAPYIEPLRKSGLTVHQISRWLNAVSVSGDSISLLAASGLPFVKILKPVAGFKGERSAKSPVGPTGKMAQRAQLDYGLSYGQLHLSQVDSLHNLGYTGQSIMIGIMDTGFDLVHPAFRALLDRGGLAATHDFINGDSDVQDQPDIQQSHGTEVWSAAAGFVEGSLIGPAFGADYVLAKTEYASQELHIEEDNWIAAAEWMDSLGADIISSSLGYIDWYDTSQLDGHTCAITIAAEAAAASGIAVVNVAGNERNNFAWRKIIPPADGDSVIAVGAVNSDGILASFSSPGPTVDGRIKPDIMGQGLQVLAANFDNDGYSYYSGTSMAAPIIAGGLALVLEAHPAWNLDKLYGTLRSTGSHHSTPNNDYGWGIAKFFNQFAVDGYFKVEQLPSNIMNGDSLNLHIALFDSLGHAGGNHQIMVQLASGTAQLLGLPSIEGPDTIVQGVYFPLPGMQKLLITDQIALMEKVIAVEVTGKKIISLEVWPNPAVDSVIFVFGHENPSWAEITILSVAGDKIADIRIDPAYGSNSLIWMARNKKNELIASGIYFAYLKTASGSRTCKFAFIKD
jgi:hypothetical protein